MAPLTLAILLLSVYTGMYCKEVKSVPGLKDKLNFRHYSGYLQARKTHLLHYWFVESQERPSSRPVLLWMNGGPGCSSLVGFLTEIGPFLINDEGTVSLNPYSWNKDFNIIFLEAPAGTGYSYSTDGNVTTNDDQTAAENYAALKIFFGTEFPQYRKNEFYIAGQSYGGVYVPTLAKVILEGLKEFELNLQGTFIGNGAVDWSIIMDTMVPYAYWHGILPQKNFTELKKECCSGKCTDDCSMMRHKENDTCTNKTNEAFNTFVSQKVNYYDIYATCYADPLTSDWQFGILRGILPTTFTRNLGKQRELLKDQTAANSGYACVDDRALVRYVNQDEFRKALYIPHEAPEWNTCRTDTFLPYERQYQETGMFEQIKQIHKERIKVFLYYGDTDLICNYALAEHFAEQLGIELYESKKPYYYDGQTAGFVTTYGLNRLLRVYTVKGAGHMAPQNKKPEVFQLINDLIFE